jgi:hypothetical protein
MSENDQAEVVCGKPFADAVQSMKDVQASLTEVRKGIDDGFLKRAILSLAEMQILASINPSMRVSLEHKEIGYNSGLIALRIPVENGSKIESVHYELPPSGGYVLSWRGGDTQEFTKQGNRNNFLRALEHKVLTMLVAGSPASISPYFSEELKKLESSSGLKPVLS